MVRLGTAMPFEQVPEFLSFLTGVQVSVETVRRLTERAGAAQAAVEERELERLERELPPVPEGPDLPPLSAEDAARHLELAARRIHEDQKSHRRAKAPAPPPNVPDW